MAEKDFDLLSWLETGTTATREVDIYINHDAYQELNRLEAEFAALEDAKAGGGLSLGEAGRFLDLEDEITAASEALVASKMTWLVRALSDKEISESLVAVPMAKAPLKPEGYLNDKVLAKLQNQAHAYAQEKLRTDKARKIWIIAQATQTITTTSGVKDGITVAEMEALLERPHGYLWLETIYQAVEAATSQDAVPTSVPK